MKTLNYSIAGMVLMICLLASPVAWAKKVVCIDDNGNANDGFLNMHEGWERATAQPGDIIVKGGSLTDCIAQLADGDELVIVAHGTGSGKGFNWGGQNYTGFGNGAGKMPIPQGFNKTGIKIRFCTCWSARDPDGPKGSDKSLLDKLIEALGGGATGGGFVDLSVASTCIQWQGGTNAQCQAVYDSLKKNTAWMNYPPHNRVPQPEQNDQACAQAIANGMAGGVTLTIIYKKPFNATSATLPAGGITSGCACEESGECGIIHSMLEDAPETPIIPMPNNLLLPNGLWRCDETIVFAPPAPGAKSIHVRNLRVYNILNNVPPPEPGMVGTFFNPITAVLEISYDGGATWKSSSANGNWQGMLMRPPINGSGIFVDITPLSISLNGLPPGEPVINGFSIVLDPALPSSGVAGFRQYGSGWSVDSFFDITYRINLNSGSSSPACGSSQMHLHCPTPGEGCTDVYSSNFEPCAIVSSQNCAGPPHGGCTYAGAANYDSTASWDNGTCHFVGCTDPTASNYDAYANKDDGSCSFASPCPADLSGDGHVNTADLLIFLGAFGVPCD